MSPRTKSAGRRLSAITVDQVIAGASNLLIALLAAHVLGVAAFGLFGIAFIIYVVAQGVSRALVSEPVLIHPVEARERPGDAIGANLVLGLLLAVAVLAGAAAAWAWNRDLGASLVALAVCLPLLVLQDLGRYLAFATQRPGRALVLDVVWLVALIAAVALILVEDARTLTWFVLAWAATGALSGVLVFQQVGIWRPRLSLSWVREKWMYSWRYLISYTSGQTSALMGSLALGGIAGPQALGAVRGALMLIRPFGTFQVAAMSASIAEVSHAAPARHELGRFVTRPTVLATGVAVVNVVALLVLPVRVGEAILGQTWASAQPLVVPAGAQIVFLALMTGVRAALLGARAIRKTVVIDVAGTVLLVVLSIAGAVVGGAAGSLWAIAIGQAVISLVWWRYFVAYTTRGSDPTVEGADEPVLVPDPLDVLDASEAGDQPLVVEETNLR